jgi:hypothetical protein
VANRIRPQIEAQLHEHQYGFRPGRSTTDAITCLLASISRTARTAHSPVPVAFLDLKKAFDLVPHSHLHRAIAQPQYGVPRTLVRWIAQAFLTDRSLYLARGTNKTTPTPVTNGVPQGAVLSPLLFIAFINTLPEYVAAACPDLDAICDVIMFADDVALVPRVGGHNAVRALSIALDACTRWANDHGMRWGVGASKSEIVNFSATKRELTPAQLRTHNRAAAPICQALKNGRFELQNQALPRAKAYKYLGVHLQYDLGPNAQYKSLRRKVNCAGALLARVCARRSRFTPALLTRMIRTYIEPILTYGIQFVQLRPAQYQRLTTLMLAPLRRALRLPANAHTASLCVDHQIVPLDLRANTALQAWSYRVHIDAERATPKPAATLMAAEFAADPYPALATFPRERVRAALQSGLITHGILEDNMREQTLRTRTIQRLLGLHTVHNTHLTDADRRWGQPLRQVLDEGPRTEHQPTGAEYERFTAPSAFRDAPLDTAATIAAARYDRFSFWRLHKTGVNPHRYPNANCHYCGHPNGTARHLLLSCPQFTMVRADALAAVPHRLRHAVRAFGSTHLPLTPPDADTVATTVAALTARIRRHCRNGNADGQDSVR